MKWVITLVFAASLCRTLARRAGAPLEACDNLTPNHGSNTPRPGQSSNSVNISDFAAENDSTSYMYMPGTTYDLSLTSTGTFRGFLIQARTRDGDMVGEFSLVEDEDNVRLSNCDPTNIAVTHNDGAVDKTSVYFQWTAPDEDVGNIQFHFTTVRGFTIFWVNETTDTIYGPGGGDGDGDGDGDDTESATGLFISALGLLAGVGAALLL